LFIHGLESGPNGRKARYLAEAGFHVVSEQMPCGRSRIALDPVVVGAGAGAAAASIAVARRYGIVGIGLVLGGALVVRPHIAARVMRRVVRRSTEVQLRALGQHRIDIVVGSSFGGAIAVDLLLRRQWQGPTVLLCPAHTLHAAKTRAAIPPPLASLPPSVSAHVVVVHGRHDDVVPIADSRALVAGSRARLLEVDDDHRLTATATPDQLRQWIAAARNP
jgi:pimeloyl-ACP methyl ester carboxylesterase